MAFSSISLQKYRLPFYFWATVYNLVLAYFVTDENDLSIFSLQTTQILMHILLVLYVQHEQFSIWNVLLFTISMHACWRIRWPTFTCQRLFHFKWMIVVKTTHACLKHPTHTHTHALWQTFFLACQTHLFTTTLWNLISSATKIPRFYYKRLNV